MTNPIRIGDTFAAIYLPSRYADGGLIPETVLEKAAGTIRGRFTQIFGGSTSTGIEKDLIGSYLQEGGPLKGFIVDERVERVWVSIDSQTYLVKPDDPKAKTAREGVFNLAGEIGAQLQQEAMGVEWGPEFYLVGAKGKCTSKRWPFSRFSEQNQIRMARVVLRRHRKLEDFSSLLSLNNWMALNPPQLASLDGLYLLARLERQSAYFFRDQSIPMNSYLRQKIGEVAKEGDLVFDQDKDGHMRVWQNRKHRLVGGRKMPPISEDGKISRISFLLALSILESPLVLTLSQMLDRSEVTASFFKAYSGLHSRLTAEFKNRGVNNDISQKEAQLLLGRLMFLRFIEQKKWLEGDINFLENLFKKTPKQFYKKALFPLFFDVLDVPKNADARRSQKDVPYINGGLFRPTETADLNLPDNFFNPQIEDSVFGIFRKYDFTLDESTASSELVSIDPSMFGFVLESLCSERERKQKGIHYTPLQIGKMLAREGILGRISILSGILKNRLKSFALGKYDSITHEEADKVKELLPKLRIVDPAVGSGSLLLATLNELMLLLVLCEKNLGQSLIQGQYKWAQSVRRFVQDCLFGVDIDPNAVEVAKLRLWLAIAVGDNEPAPLPDLDYNIRVGDSLSELLEPERTDQLGLTFDELSKARNSFLNALYEYKRASGPLMRVAAEGLSLTEREYVIRYLELNQPVDFKNRIQEIRKGGPLPFFWHIHFAEVFRSPNKGFDVVIANPPYVRAQNLALLSKGQINDLVNRFKSMRLGAKDLYLAFVEQGLRLVGKAGKLAFIMGNFSRTKSGRPLREILKQRGAVDLWVDFGDIQVFETATNYVALLFARAEKSRQKSFECRRPDRETWPPSDDEDWLQNSPPGKVVYGDIWRTLSSEEDAIISNLEKNSRPLGKFVEEIGVGVQTSADEVYLLGKVQENDRKIIKVSSSFLGKEIEIEETILKTCAKGSVHIRPYRIESDTYILWPYDGHGESLSESVLKKRHPLAWDYLKKCKKRLLDRDVSESYKFPERWWRFGREQGLVICRKPKILIPSTMSAATAAYDQEGKVAFTASGKGGGGAWGLLTNEKSGNSDLLLAVLNSKTIWNWFNLEGDPKKGGWRGVDKALLTRVPIPSVPKRKMEEVVKLVKQMGTALSVREDTHNLINEIEIIIEKAYRSKRR